MEREKRDRRQKIKRYVRHIKENAALQTNPTNPFNTPEWKAWEEQLGLAREGTVWAANTPDGRRPVNVTFVNFIPSIYYEADGKKRVTHVPSLSPDIITRGDVFVSKKIPGKFLKRRGLKK